MSVKLGQELFSIKHLVFCELPGIRCKLCDKEVAGEVGYFVSRGNNSYWCCLEHGIKDNAINIKGTDAWTLAIMVRGLQKELDESEGGM